VSSTNGLLVDETKESFNAALHAKVAGALALHRLIKDEPNSVFVSFASVNGLFGGATAGAYAAANSFAESFARTQTSNPTHYCFNWSMWDGVA
jgi:hypothetical protein